MIPKILPALGAALALSACATYSDLPTDRAGQASLTYANGLPAGTAQLLETGDGLELAVAVTGMSPGAHGFHLHETGRCEAPGFTSAGGHLNPHGKSHGSRSPMGSHLGDLPNLQVGANGSATARVLIDEADEHTLGHIFDADGTAVVIHAGADDYRTDPAGDAGPRLACGVLRR
ncbi:MAG: superoxide dismutase family protein [Qipengyuania sp.]